MDAQAQADKAAAAVPEGNPPGAAPASTPKSPSSQQAGSAFTNLPTAVLWEITRRAGPRARLVCRAMRDLHPPPAALHLRTRPLPPPVTQRLLAHCWHFAAAVASLTLPPAGHPRAPSSGRPSPALPPSAAPALAAAVSLFPNVRTLAYTTHSAPLQAELKELAPLRQHLTALTIHRHPASARAAAPYPPRQLPPLPKLPALRRLALPCTLPPADDLPPWISSLPKHLCDLTLDLTNPCVAATLLPALASATPRLTSLRLLHAPLAWSPSSVAAFRTALRHLAHFHLHLGPTSHSSARSHPQDGFDLASQLTPDTTWAALGAALRHRTDAGLVLTAELNLACHPGAGSWAPPLLPHLSPTELTLRLTPTDTPMQPPLAAAVWPWLASKRRLRALTIHYPAPRLAPLPDAPLLFDTSPSLPLCPVLADAQRITRLSLTSDCLPYEGTCPAAISALRPLTKLAHLHLSGPPSAPWPPHATAPLTALTALQHLSVACGGLPRGVLPHLPHLPLLRSLTLAGRDAGALPPAAREAAARAAAAHRQDVQDQDLALLLPLRSRLTSLSLLRLPKVKGPGLSVLRALTHLERLQLADVALATPDWQRHLLPLPGALNSLEVEGPACLTPEARTALGAAARRQGCRVRVDGAVTGGLPWPFDAAVLLPEEERRSEEERCGTPPTWAAAAGGRAAADLHTALAPQAGMALSVL